MNSVLVIVVTYNGLKWIDKCLKSIYYSSIPLDAFVIDNGSTDGTQKFIRENFTTAYFHQSLENIGFGKANNIGLQYAIDNDYDYVYLLNQDAWIMPETIEKLITVHKHNSDYGILSPIQLQANMQHFDINFVSGVCSYSSNPCLFEDLFFSRTKEVYEVTDVMAAHWLISRKCLCTVGGFSPTFSHYGEDNNYVDRTLFNNLKVGIAPSIIAIHDREKRKESVDKRIYTGFYASSLVNLSDISHKHNIIGKKMLARLIRFVFLYNSLQPLKYYLKLFFSYTEIMKNRELSKITCAFLYNNTKR